MSIVPFDKARPGEEAFTYTPDPTGEYGWVTDTDWFDVADLSEPLTVKRQQWQLICEDQVTFYPNTYLCEKCQGEGVIDVPEQELTDVTCPRCKGDERDPKAGEMRVTG